MKVAAALSLILGVLLVIVGAGTIHPGLGMIALGALGVWFSYVL